MTEDIPQNRPKKAGGGIQAKDFTQDRSALDQTGVNNSKKTSSEKNASKKTTK